MSRDPARTPPRDPGPTSPRQPAERTRTVSRRRFAAEAGAAALLPLAVGWPPLLGRTGSVGPAMGATGGADPSLVEAATSVPGRQEAQEEEAPPGTDALLDYVRARYGERLDEEALEIVREEIAGSLRSAEALREVPLENGDEPACAFRAWRADEGGAA